MKISIKPEDKSRPEEVKFSLHPDLLRRLDAYAESLDKSSRNHVLSQILDQVLPKERVAKKERKPKAPKPVAIKEEQETAA